MNEPLGWIGGPGRERALSEALQRNFMGYTEFRTTVLLGIGVSAISETSSCLRSHFFDHRLRAKEPDRPLFLKAL